MEGAITIPFEEHTVSTNTKAHAAKYFINQHFRQIFEYKEKRVERLKRVEKQISQDGATKEELQYRLKELAYNETQYLRMLRNRMRVRDFQILALLGKGGFGEVFLCLKRTTWEILALKRIKKAQYINRNEETRVKMERDVLVETFECKSPWITQLRYSFQDEHHLYLIMEYMPGGDLGGLLDNVGALSVNHTRFYAAEVVLAVSELHALGYIHRDLKPSNFLITNTGHLKLADFGLSKAGVSSQSGTWKRMHDTMKARKREGSRSQFPSLTRKKRLAAKSIVGSPEYMAPEILEGQGYNHSVDFWAVGCMIHEMLTGFTPFYAEDVQEVFENVLNHKQTLRYPDFVPETSTGTITCIEDCMPPVAWDLITKLLASPNERLGSGTAYAIMEHEFFKGINFKEIDQEDPPFVPELESDLDTSYFPSPEEEEDIARLIDEELQSYLKDSKKASSAFQGFTYVPNRRQRH